MNQAGHFFWSEEWKREKLRKCLEKNYWTFIGTRKLVIFTDNYLLVKLDWKLLYFLSDPTKKHRLKNKKECHNIQTSIMYIQDIVYYFVLEYRL